MDSPLFSRDPHAINADLHCHSDTSDGLLTPTELAQRALEGGVELWALTDHDELAGQEEAAAAAFAVGLPYVHGVEISVTWASDTLHIVGLHLDARNEALLNGLQKTRSGRALRAQKMSEQLAAVGIEGAYEGALTYAGNEDLIGRTHFARFLVDRGVCRDVRDVFTKYLVPGRPGYVPVQWASLSEAIEWITGAGGVAVIAHPGRYKISDVQMAALLEEFKAKGGGAIEVITGSHTVDQYRKYARYASDYGLMASRGSDFHGPGESRVPLGSLPPLPDSVVPVWHDWV